MLTKGGFNYRIKDDTGGVVWILFGINCRLELG